MGQDAHGRRGRGAGAGGEYRRDAEDAGQGGAEGDGVVLYVHGGAGAVVRGGGLGLQMYRYSIIVGA